MIFERTLGMEESLGIAVLFLGGLLLLNLELMLKEASKCVVLCANCHRELHAGIITLDKVEQIV
jgi:hypothetical protein